MAKVKCLTKCLTIGEILARIIDARGLARDSLRDEGALRWPLVFPVEVNAVAMALGEISVDEALTALDHLQALRSSAGA